MPHPKDKLAQPAISPETAIVGCIVPHDTGVAAYDMYSNVLVSVDESEQTILEGLFAGVAREAIVDGLRELNADPAYDPYSRYDSFLRTCREQGVFQPVSLGHVAEVRLGPADIHQLEHHLGQLVLGVTEDCNFRCKYCAYSGLYEDNRTHTSRSMTTDVALRALDFFLSRADETRDLVALSFYGGEPLLEFGLIQEVVPRFRASVSEREHIVSITTNGSLLRRAEIRDFLVTNDISLTVSLDGPASIHDHWRVSRIGKGTHKRVVEGLEALREDHPGYYRSRVQFNAVVARPYPFKSVASYFEKLSLFQDSTGIVRLNPVNGQTSDPEALRRLAPSGRNEHSQAIGEFVKNRKAASRPQDGLDSMFGNKLVTFAQRRIGPVSPSVHPHGFCLPGKRKLFVDPAGAFGMCERVGAAIPIGSLDTGFDYQAISQVIDGLTRQWTRDCSFCVARRFCGKCPAPVHKEGSIDSERFAEHCEATRRYFASELQVFINTCLENPGFHEELLDTTIS